MNDIRNFLESLWSRRNKWFVNTSHDPIVKCVTWRIMDEPHLVCISEVPNVDIGVSDEFAVAIHDPY